MPVENETSQRNGCTPSRERNRSSTSLSDENYDLVWKEARRRGFPMTVTLNLLLEELTEWRSGARRFNERRKQVRSAEAKARPSL